MIVNPKVFISHASEDKDRFVLDFAKKLCAVGIDAWIDKWEMLPGDSLVDKIFEEGIKNAQAFIFIISNYSIQKPWVKEELNTAIINRISRNTKIIPVVLDGVDVPECLKSTLYEPISNLTVYDESFERIRNAVFNICDKPVIGEMPRHVISNVNSYAGLNKLDSIILYCICELAIEEKSTFRLNSNILFERLASWEISQTDFKISLDILDRKGYIKGTRVIEGDIPVFELSFFGLEVYIGENYSDFDLVERRVHAGILNNEGNNIEIADKINIPVVIVNYVFNRLKSRGLINYHLMANGAFWIWDVSPELRRILEKA